MMIFKRILYVVVYVIGVALVALAILFFIASSSNPSRVGTAVACGAAGIGAFFTGSILKRNSDTNNPILIDRDIITLAAKYDGRLTVDMAVSELEITRPQALESLDRLVDAGVARPEVNPTGQHYIFASVKPKRMIRRCIYCGREFPLAQPVTVCSYCGGTVKIIPRED